MNALLVSYLEMNAVRETPLSVNAFAEIDHLLKTSAKICEQATDR